MTDFSIMPPALQDPSLRVNYAFGQVLGVDEFAQEQLHHVERNRLHNRLLHGYGTVWGLRVSYENDVEPVLRVKPGVAVNPLGQEIRVTHDMCLKIHDWLGQHRSEIEGTLISPPRTIGLCLVLCYRECETHPVPIRGQPCQSQDSTVAASRITSDFTLKLRLDTPPRVTSPPGKGDERTCRPPQPEEDLGREFGRLLSELEITDNPAADFLTVEALKALVRGLASSESPTSPPLSPPPSPPASPPLSITARAIRPDEACEMFDAAFLTWVTEVRPTVLVTDPPGPCQPVRDNCVLLADIDLDIVLDSQEGTLKVDGEPRILEDRRPYLLHTRLLQEWIACVGWRLAGGATMTSPPGSSSPPGTAVAPDGSSLRVIAAGRFEVIFPTFPPGAVVRQSGPTFNALTARPSGTGSDWEYLLHFPGYEPPRPNKLTYLLKGWRQEPGPVTNVKLLNFENDGIRIGVVKPRRRTARTPHSFTVELTRIEGPR